MFTLLRFMFLAVLIALPLGPLAAPPGVKAFPLEHTPRGVRFIVQAPGAQQVYLAGTFNGWGGSDGYTISDPDCLMFGPDERGIFETFVSLTPGTHIFKYAIDGNIWMSGPPDLPFGHDDFDRTAGQAGIKGSAFEFSLTEPPWPSYVPTWEMLPVIRLHNTTQQPYLRVRFFSRQAETAHVVGSWDGWGGIDPGGRAVFAESHAMYLTQVPNIWEAHIGPLQQGVLEYKLVANNRQWLSDPSVMEYSEDGNTRMTIYNQNGQWFPVYTPRFDPNAKREDTSNRWGGTLAWEDDRNAGFAKARLTKQPMIWVITLPKSPLSVNLMQAISGDDQLVEKLSDFVTLETPANEVRDILQRRGIYRVPHVVLVDSNYKPVWEKFNPSLDEVKAQVAAMSNAGM